MPEIWIGKKKKRIKIVNSYGLVAVGTIFMAAGTKLVYEPMSMVTGGFAGIGIIVRHFFPLPLWMVITILNVPLFAAALKKKGWKFAGRALYGMTCFSVALAVFPRISFAFEDFLMAALLGGVMNGIGLALVFRQGASTGGSDLLAMLLADLFDGISAAVLLAVIDGAIVVAGMIVFGVKIGLYSVVAVFVTTKLTDSILEGLKFAKMLYIISSKPEYIADCIMEKLDRGVTALNGEGMYSGEEKEVLMCAASRREAVSIVRLVREADEHAFVIISDVREVLGEGFGG